MSAETWKCNVCGTEGNSGMFCNYCGAPFASSPDFFGKDDPAKLSQGILTGLVWSSYQSGMMAYSRQSFETEINWNRDGSVTVTLTEESEGEYRRVTVYDGDPDKAEQMRKIIADEKVEEWANFDKVNDPMLMPTDVSSSSHLTLTFSEGDNGLPADRCSIDLDAAKQNGKAETVYNLGVLLASLRSQDRIIKTDTETLTLPNGMTKQEYFKQFMPINNTPSWPVQIGSREGESISQETASGEWKCPVCGEINTGKFCYGCGSKRPGT